MRDGAHLLYVDDDAGLCRLVEKALTRDGYRVETVDNGPAGVARVAAGGIDVVALDHYMPGQDGLETLAAITTLDDAPPVVYVTGTQEGRVAVAALKAGAANYVVKEASGEFLDLLRAALDGALAAAAIRKAKDAAEAEVREARDRFEAIAQQRALLLREVDHRIGNSLQLIASLLHLQATGTQDGEIEAALKRASRRVRAVARVHRRLYTSGDVRSVALDQYLRTLLDDLAESYESGACRLSVAEMVPVDVSPDRAVAIGIITTELVINAQKHAYPGADGEIVVGLSAVGRDFVLSVEDNGIGYQRDASPSSGLGTLIIDEMTTKIEGRFWYDPTTVGTRACLRFVSDRGGSENAATTAAGDDLPLSRAATGS